jgi:hypothetical protein
MIKPGPMELTLTHVRVVDSIGLLVHWLLEWLLQHMVCSDVDTRTQPNKQGNIHQYITQVLLDVNELEEREHG